MGQTSAKHPKGLWVLFGTEMWERFNFYGMRTILTLFIVNALMMSKEQSSLIYGGFLGLCYLTPMLGGFIADRFLGTDESGREVFAGTGKYGPYVKIEANDINNPIVQKIVQTIGVAQ